MSDYEKAFDAERDMAEDAMRDEHDWCRYCGGTGLIKETHGMEGPWYELLPCDHCENFDRDDDDTEEEEE